MRAMAALFGEQPFIITLGKGRDGLIVGLAATAHRRYEVDAFVFPRSTLTDALSRQQSEYLRSGFSFARVRNVIITASRPNSLPGRLRLPFRTPHDVSTLIARLRAVRATT